jgi:hypothetical protein
MTDELVKRLRECSPYGLGLIDVQREEAADRIETQAALIKELVGALERVHDEQCGACRILDDFGLKQLLAKAKAVQP